MPTILLFVLVAAARLVGASEIRLMLNTAPLAGHPAGPFAFEAQLTGTANTVRFTDFVFDGGGPSGTPVLTGSAEGDLQSGFTLRTNTFYNAFVQSFIPGNAVSFTLHFTPINAPGFPDHVSVSILDSLGVEIPTEGLAAIGADVILSMDITSNAVQPRLFGSDRNRVPQAAGPAITMSPPTVVPEPALFALFGFGLIAIGILGRKHRNSGM